MKTLEYTKKTLLFLLMAGIGLGFNAQAEEYYTWIDENGVRNYGEKIPIGYEGMKLEAVADKNYTPGSKPASSPGSESDEGEEGEAEGEIDVSEEAKEFQAQIAKAKAANCQIGKRNLAQLQSFPRIRVKDKDGNQKFLSEDEKQAEVDEARKLIRENCNG